MVDVHLTLSSDECDLLVQILEGVRKQKRVEVHRTEFSRDFRREVEAEETLVSQLLEKLSHTATNV
jgi:hypothetical protein